MNLIKNISISLVASLILAYLGAFFTGYTAAFVMPISFASFMWVWDVFVVQFLGFGFLAFSLAFIIVYFFRLNFLLSVFVIFVFTQFNLSIMSGSFNLYWPHILTMLICLVTGWFTACKKYV